MTNSERSLFELEMAGVRPLKANESVSISAKPIATPGQRYRLQQAQFTRQELDGPLSLVLRQQLRPDDWVSFKQNGVQTGVFKNLRLGKYPLEATLVLTGKKPHEALDELLQFVADCDQCNIRSVLISFGRKGHAAALLKSYLAQWLPEIESVQACHTALRQHGGCGALYVLLRKSEQKRLENRERHAARLGW